MKNTTGNLIQFLFCVCSAILIQGCDDPDYLYDYGITTYQVNNRENIRKELTYTDQNSPFQMAAPTVHAPLLSQRGDVSITADFGHTLSGGYAVALTDKNAFRIGIGRGNYKSEEQGKVFMDVEYTYFENSQPTTGSLAGIYNYYRKNSSLTRYAEMAFGRYKVYTNQFRNEAWLGAGYGKTESKYAIDLPYGFFYSQADFAFEDYIDSRKHVSLFIQDDIGIVTDFFEASLTGKSNGYKFISRDARISTEATIPDYEPYAFTFEPAIRIASGSKKIRFYVQYETVVPIQSDGLKWYGSQFKGGVFFRIGDIISN